ncbi:MAG: bile acid:sodium symporter family protein [Oscillibacter sp.]|nr:bile acid:sodium symporter family protein [Oscillibacter sp.]
MKILNSIDAFIGKNIPWLSIILTAIGIFFSAQLSWLSGCTFWLFIFITFASSLSAGFSDMKTVVLHPKPIVAIFLTLHVVMPLIAMGIGSLVFPDNPYFVTGLVLENCIPTGVTSLMWVSMCRGNTPLALCAVLLDTLLSPFVVPLSLKLLIGSEVELDVGGMIRNLIFMIAIPALLAMVCNQATHGRVVHTVQPKLNPFAKMAMVLVITANATGIADSMRNLNPRLILVFVVGLCVSVLGFVFGFLFSRVLKVDYATALCMTLNCGMRNINAGAVLAAQYFPADVLFPVVTSSLMLHPLNGISVSLLQHSKAGKTEQAEYKRTHTVEN